LSEEFDTTEVCTCNTGDEVTAGGMTFLVTFLTGTFIFGVEVVATITSVVVATEIVVVAVVIKLSAGI
jgi:hypothetical protein